MFGGSWMYRYALPVLVSPPSPPSVAVLRWGAFALFALRCRTNLLAQQPLVSWFQPWNPANINKKKNSYQQTNHVSCLSEVGCEHFVISSILLLFRDKREQQCSRLSACLVWLLPQSTHTHTHTAPGALANNGQALSLQHLKVEGRLMRSFVKGQTAV